MREVIHESDRVKIGGIRISSLRYADDMVLIADSEISLRNLVKKSDQEIRSKWAIFEPEEDKSTNIREKQSSWRC